MPNKTSLFSVYQPGGSFAIADIVRHPGSVFFVHSGTGTDGAGFGKNPDAPCATVDYAIGLCTDDKGDVIYVLPGHAETIAATAGFNADKIGISIIGLGNGTNRPTFTFTGTASQVNIGAVNVTIENLRFVAGISAVVSAVQVESKTDFTCRNCEWNYSGTTDHDFVIMLELEANSHRALIEGCQFLTEPATVGTAAGIQIASAAHNTIIRNNVFMGDFSTSCVNQITALTQGLMFVDNLVYNTNAGETYLEAHANTTGIIARTRGKANAGTVAANAVGAKMIHAENYVAKLAGTIAILRGAGGSPALDIDAA